MLVFTSGWDPYEQVAAKAAWLKHSGWTASLILQKEEPRRYGVCDRRAAEIHAMSGLIDAAPGVGVRCDLQ